MFCVICYDVSEDKNRARLFKVMKKYGLRIQRSVFEGDLSHTQVDTLIEEVKEFIDKTTDSLRLYMICSTCKAQARSLGSGEICDFPPSICV